VLTVSAAVAAGSAVSCSELGTATDDSPTDRQTPINIRFTPSLTYAEKLLLKKSRRMDLPSPDLLTTSRSCDSAFESHRQDGHLEHAGASEAGSLNYNCNSSNRGMSLAVVL